jgi:hypothetical protein
MSGYVIEMVAELWCTNLLLLLCDHDKLVGRRIGETDWKLNHIKNEI